MAGEHEDKDETGGEYEETADVIRKAIEAAEAVEDDDNDDGGFDMPAEDGAAVKSTVVSAEEGVDLKAKAEEASFKSRRKVDKADDDFQKTIDAEAENADDDKDAAKGDEAETEGEKKADDAEADKPKGTETEEKADDAAAISADPATVPAELSELLDGLDATKAAEVAKRLDDAAKITGLFRGRDAELKLHGVESPEKAVDRLLYLNKFAQDKPDEYLAWVASSINPAAAHEVMEKAAAHLGYKLVPDVGDADEFEDEATTKIRRENERLQRQLNGLNFGPDTAAQQRLVALDRFQNETNPHTGQPVRPYVQMLLPRITEITKAHVATTGTPATVEDLQRAYDAAVKEMQANPPPGFVPAPAPQTTSAAQPAAAVPQPKQTTAAPAQKVSASKQIDGDGQGANRRPALSPNADLKSVIGHYAKQSE